MIKQSLVQLLHDAACSLVVENRGETRTYGKKGVRDLMWLLDHEPERLRGARVADKVVGKAAAGLMAQGGVSEVYASVMSCPARQVLEQAGIPYGYGVLVDNIVIEAGDDRCPLEQIVMEARTPQEIENLLRQHFIHMASRCASSL
ncbi:MAG: DUF1893 domain-containing protein [Muribaculaceae bacterium]|nr:DUF1893 domain-containing protein [Muribaculaceae bacterium]